MTLPPLTLVLGGARSGKSRHAETLIALANGIVTTEARKQLAPARRFGTSEEFGALCAFVCSAQAGFLTGQNLLIDGGAYPGSF